MPDSLHPYLNRQLRSEADARADRLMVKLCNDRTRKQYAIPLGEYFEANEVPEERRKEIREMITLGEEVRVADCVRLEPVWGAK